MNAGSWRTSNMTQPTLSNAAWLQPHPMSMLSQSHGQRLPENRKKPLPGDPPQHTGNAENGIALVTVSSRNMRVKNAANKGTEKTFIKPNTLLQ
ncbi:unnamed protein product [Echinostoma caproni]|uniref:BAT2_N domain-containing protein n=1 Tax=Echinostoma caproni TaxID=27848 RepID=A0A183B9Z6_9TREM|nr:unnamed protein product [Echinostoma caproni]